jgi:hypothetical protein
MNTINVDGNIYYNATIVKKKHPAIFVGCKKIRRFIVKHRLDEDEYMYAIFKDKKWQESHVDYCKARLLILKSSMDDIIARFNTKKRSKKNTKAIRKNDKKQIKPKTTVDKDDSDSDSVDKDDSDSDSDDDNKQVKPKTTVDKDDSDNDSDDDNKQVKPKIEINKDDSDDESNNDDDTYSDSDSDDNSKSRQKYSNGKIKNVLVIPSLLKLTDDEKFKDEKGRMLEIETRGTRESKGCYFNMQDIRIKFGVDRIKETIEQKNSNYVENRDYVYFSVPENNRDVIYGSVKKNSEDLQMYLTYNGLIKMLYTTKNSFADIFQDWATTTLFTTQMGTLGQKRQLVSRVLGVPIKDAQGTLKTSVGPISCIYLYSLGIAKDLRKSMMISKRFGDKHVILKFGETENLSRRNGELETEYSSIKGCKLSLKNYVFIDPKYTEEAEKELKEYFREYKLEYDGHKELVIVSEEKLKDTVEKYKNLGTKYSAPIEEMKQLVIQLQTELKNMKKEHVHEIKYMQSEHKCELLKKDVKLSDKNTEIQKLTRERDIAVLNNKSSKNTHKLDNDSDSESD